MGIKVGLFKVRKLTCEVGFMSKQSGLYRYKHVKVDMLSIPNLLSVNSL